MIIGFSQLWSSRFYRSAIVPPRFHKDDFHLCWDKISKFHPTPWRCVFMNRIFFCHRWTDLAYWPLTGVESLTGEAMSKEATLKSSMEANAAGPRRPLEKFARALKGQNWVKNLVFDTFTELQVNRTPIHQISRANVWRNRTYLTFQW